MHGMVLLCRPEVMFVPISVYVRVLYQLLPRSGRTTNLS